MGMTKDDSFYGFAKASDRAVIGDDILLYKAFSRKGFDFILERDIAIHIYAHVK
jgi:hypothetical protein